MRRVVPITRVAGLLTTTRGLTTPEAQARRRQYGPNTIVETPPSTWRDLLRDTVQDPMIWFLLGTSAVYAFLGQYVEALTLCAASVPVVGMDAFLHRRTQASTQGLTSRLATQATVVRDGATQTIPATEVVPGDLALVGAGEPWPADGIVLHGAELQADESALTGEAYPVRKHPLREDGADDEVSVDAVHWGFAGTRLLTGQALLRVIATGRETLYGAIVRAAVGGRHARTLLQQAIAQLVGVLIVVAALLCLMLAWVRLHQGHGWVDALVSAVTLAVAALPEEFPVVFTCFLGVGVYRLARRQALVRRAVVVENIGRVSYICADKTGTLTEGRLRLAHAYPAPGVTAERLLTVAASASRRDSGDPLDRAILEAAPPGSETAPRLATFPFTEDRGRETAIRGDTMRRIVAAVKGAPEVVLPLTTLTAEERTAWGTRVVELAAAGYKVIACAWRELDLTTWPGGEPDRGLTLAGLLACADPVRAGVVDAVQRCRQAGIHVLMVTGDHPETARAVARAIGLGSGNPTVISADALGPLLAQPEPVSMRRIDVVARAIPAQKLEIVRHLMASGEIVALTGDGVNDVPALQAADIGIAMGERGTRSAREVAAIVLLDDNLRTIVQAIAEGRQLYQNLCRSFAYLLMIHMPLVLTAAWIPFAGYPLLYLPLHIVWLELIIHPTALLVFQGIPQSDALPRLPPGRERRFFTRREWLVVGLVGALMTLAVVGGYAYSLGVGRDVEHARAMALVVLSVASATLTAGLSGLRHRTARVMVTMTLGLSVVLVQTPGLATLLNLTPLHLDDWLLAVAGGVLVAILPAFTWPSVRASAMGAVDHQP